MRELLDSGAIGAVGVSNYSLARWQKADAALGRPVISNQVHFSLAHPRRSRIWSHSPSGESHRHRLQPLAQGLLGGKYGVDNRPVAFVR